jgi:hypothetical protein
MLVIKNEVSYHALYVGKENHLKKIEFGRHMSTVPFAFTISVPKIL